MGRVVRTGRAASGKAIFRSVATAAVLSALVACSNGDSNAETATDPPTERIAPDGTVFNDADVTFVQAMVAHHRQTVEIAELASVPANEASEWLPPLAERIRVERQAEIDPLQALLAAWAVDDDGGAATAGGSAPGDSGTGSPDAAASGADDSANGDDETSDGDGAAGGDGATGGGEREGEGAGVTSSRFSFDDQFVDPTDTPGAQGMMSVDEMTDLATTIGGDFDRLWLSMMIRHHEGAIAMCAQLLVDGRNAELRSMATTMSSTYQRAVAEMSAALIAVSPPTR